MQDGCLTAQQKKSIDTYITQLTDVRAGLTRLLYEIGYSESTGSSLPTSSTPDLLETKLKLGSSTSLMDGSLGYLQFTIFGQTPLSARERVSFKMLCEQASLGLCSALVQRRFGPLEVEVASRSGEEVASTRLRVSSLGISKLPSPAPSTQPPSSETGPGDPSSSMT